MLNIFNPSTLWAILNAVIDICCTWAIFYYVLKIVRNNSRTVQIFKGVVLIIFVQFIANLFDLKTMGLLVSMFVNWGPLALIVLFTPEIRSMLEKIGQTNILSRISTLTVNEREFLVDELVKAAVELSNTQTGALISIEQGHSLSDFIKTGTKMSAVVNAKERSIVPHRSMLCVFSLNIELLERILNEWNISAIDIAKNAIVIPSELCVISHTPDSI